MKIHEANYVKSAPKLRDCPDFGDAPEIVLVGRSNVGKSSFINSLTQRKNLARTSNTPGKTRYINFYEITYSEESSPENTSGRDTGTSQEQSREQIPQKLIMVDLPGYGYAKVSKTEQEQWRRSLEEYLLKRESIRLVIQLMDARHGPQENDRQMLAWLTHHQKPVQVVLTKMDKLSRNEAAKQVQQAAKTLDFPIREILPFSAETHQGRDEAWRIIQELSESTE